jgi:tetratricopeptide (TPR) repeat protein
VTTSDDGFSFGAPAIGVMDNDDPGDGKSTTAIIDVLGEPVSRSEAKSLGYSSFGNLRAGSTRAVTRIMHRPLPPDLEAPLADKMETAWNHLRCNELDEAMTLAQEVAWEKPDLVSAKLLIARCFIVRDQNDKALAILSAIPDPERDAEILYYTGFCQSRLGKTKEAIATLQQSQKNSTDTLIRQRAGDLLLSLRGEKSICPLCGRKFDYESLVEAGDRLLCPDCAREELEKAGDDDPEDGETNAKRRKRLRPPLTPVEMAIRIVFVLFFFFMLGFSVYLVYLLSPEHYKWLRSNLPYVGEFMPPPPYIPPPPSSLPVYRPPRVLPAVDFSSPPLQKAMARVPVTHKLALDGMSIGKGEFKVEFDPVPSGPFELDKQNGILTWTPSLEDGGKTFTITFDADLDEARANKQVNRLTVSDGPQFRRLGTLPNASPGKTAFMIASDITGDGEVELALFSGDYWRGEIAIFSPGADGGSRRMATAALSGRPAGMGFIKADEETWLAVPDYWNSRLRFFAFRNQSLAEMSMDIDLPGRPILAGFNAETSVSAVLCQINGETRLICYRQLGQLANERIGDWKLPNGYIWRRIFVLPVPGREIPAIVAMGSSFGRTVLLMEPGEAQAKIIQRTGWDGILIDAVPSSVRPAIHCLWDKNGRRFAGILEIPVSAAPPNASGAAERNPSASDTAPALGARAVRETARDFKEIRVVGPPALCGFAALNQSGSSADIMILGASRLDVAFDYGAPGSDNVYSWPLPAPARLFGQLTPISKPDAENPEVAFMDADGNIWAIAMAVTVENQ